MQHIMLSNLGIVRIFQHRDPTHNRGPSCFYHPQGHRAKPVAVLYRQLVSKDSVEFPFRIRVFALFWKFYLIMNSVEHRVHILSTNEQCHATLIVYHPYGIYGDVSGGDPSAYMMRRSRR